MDNQRRPRDGLVRAIVVYRQVLLRDIAVRVLTDAGVEVAVAVRPEQLSLSLIKTLHADAIVVDRAAKGLLEGLGWDTVLNDASGSVSRVVTIGLADNTMVVCSRRLVPDATVQNLVQAVLGAQPDPPTDCVRSA